ncbi:MAG TPA: glycosyltransferase [Candidatus Acidoferrum sp.]|nr:glycosyltransferase [Candidatus Acidoferrum sp.]
MDITVILCTWNRAKMLAIALASIEACVARPQIQWEVLVVDNNSSDDTRAVCESFVERNPGRFRYLFEGKQGKSYALNAGVQNSKGRILAFTDDDLTVDANWIEALYETFEQQNCAGVGGKIVPVWTCEKPVWLDFDGPYAHTAFGGIVRFDHGKQISELSTAPIGANMAYRREILEKYGPFRPDLCRVGNLLGGEDSEYGRRLLKSGEKLLFVPSAIVYHPVERQRTERKYFRAWAYHYGRWIIRVDGVPNDVVRYFGVPRFMLPVCANYLFRWLSSFGAKRRLYYQLLFLQTIGEMVEARRRIAFMHAKPAGPGLNPAN